MERGATPNAASLCAGTESGCRSCRCAALAGCESGAGTAGIGPWGHERGRGRWPPRCCRDTGQTGTRLPLAATAATAAAWAQGRACSGGLGGPAALTASVSPKMVTSFLLACLERLTLICMWIKQAVCGMEFVFTTRILSHS